VTGANDFMKTNPHTKLEGQRLLPAAPLLGIVVLPRQTIRVALFPSSSVAILQISGRRNVTRLKTQIVTSRGRGVPGSWDALKGIQLRIPKRSRASSPRRPQKHTARRHGDNHQLQTLGRSRLSNVRQKSSYMQTMPNVPMSEPPTKTL